MESIIRYCLMLALLLVAMVLSADQGKLVAHAAPSDYLAPHNAARSAVGVAPLVWDTTLEYYARNFAQTQMSRCLPLTHSGGSYGENIYWRSPYGTPANAVAAWVAEKQYYNYATNTCASSRVCGHYTQVVWRATTKLGCAAVNCTSGGTFIVCSYSPPGNYIGRKPY